ncbi:MAG TPA: hypothetical protein PKW08_06225 [Flavobacteriaceae bacterium]|nr:hypothetical protein [Flavobacteriaceae bacterium]HQU21166.1 hypothetical protein [Flavobacteriaceae bacterium]HQU65366.1 hypothetical protein [Flavobacteriaceae bacterium]HRW45429.1 hypothetical protein [Flavobacteriaceae bacterium]
MRFFLMIHLYFDPGLGAMIVQAIVAAAAGVLLFSKNVMYKVKAFFGLTKKADDTYDSIDIEEDETQEHDSKK